MKRQVVLLLGSLGIILVVFIASLVVVGRGGKRPVLPQAPPVATTSRGPASRGVVAPQEGTDFRAVTRDKDGRLKRVLTAPYYENKGQGVYVLTKPKAVLYQSGGQEIQISADQGKVITDSLRSDQGAIRLTVKRGDLQGHVMVYFDRSTALNKPPVETRTSDPNVMVVSADNINFDNEKLLLYTNDRVRVSSPQMEISGRGLSIRWNEDPQELQMLRLEQGDGMVIRSVPGEGVELLALPGGEQLSTVTAQEETGAEPPPAEPVAVEKPVAKAPSRPRTAATKESGASRPVRRQARNVYKAIFNDRVSVEQGKRYVHGADTLALEFQWAGAREKNEEVAAAPPQAKVTPGELVAPAGPGGESPPPTKPSAKAPAAPATVQAKVSAPPATQPAGEPIHLTWTGPLEIVPAGFTENPSRKNVAVSGRGGVVTLFDGATSALCREFEFRRTVDPLGDRREGWLAGPADRPAVLTLNGGEEIVCQLMRFMLSSAGDTARLEGSGYIVRPSGAGGEGPLGGLAEAPQRPARERPPTSQPTEPNKAAQGGEFECISWADGVDVKLARDRAVRGGVYIRQAHFRGDVELSSSGRGDNLRCDDLNVEMGQRPATATAGRLRTFVKTVLAEGNVTVRSGQDQGKWQAYADRLVGDPMEGTAMLSGAPARLTSRNSALSGKEIYFRAFKDADGSFIRGAGLAHVAGEGTLDMQIDKDLSGNQLKAPRPATVTWTQEMRYLDYGRSAQGPREGQDGAPAMASFSGQVRLTSGDEEMTCNEMRATFRGPAATGGTVAEASPAPASGGATGLNLGTIDYGGALWKVFAYQDVVLKSHRRDRQGRVQGLVELRTGSLVYDAVDKIADSDKGWMLVQDLRPPLQKSQPINSESRMPAEDLESPSQTYFEWSQAMHLALQTRMVQLTGDVWMRHAGGDRIVEREALKAKWNIQDWPDPLPAGRLTDLQCDTLLAQFAAATPTARAKPKPSLEAAEPNATAPEDLQTGLNLLGPLDLFVATGSVLLKDDPWEVVGQKLTYERKEDLVTVLGSQDGKGPINARISRKEQDRVVTNESPWLRWYRKNATRTADRVETGPMTGSGVLLPSSRPQGR
jgi:lipopolysaccharide export system protein LptA